MKTPLRALIVDDQPLARSGLRRLLSLGDPPVEVVAECDDGDQLRRQLVATPADVVVLDMRMQRMDGAEAITSIQSLPNPPPILVLTTFDDDETIARALGAGASGFILKDAAPEDLTRAVVSVANGDGWLDPTVTKRVLRSLPPFSPVGSNQLGSLTAKEHDVLRLIATGASNAEIAQRLEVSVGTVKTHVSHVLAKLHLRDRAAAIVFAFENRLG